ncbi:MAG: 4-alpha-glucanotransferase [Opitutales bacterium]
MKSAQAPLFDWLRARGVGYLAHISTLPNDQGIGNFGPEARWLVDVMAEAGMHYWQVCPLGPTGYGDSPYQSFSAFAGNPYFIDLRELQRYGLLAYEELHPLRQLPRERVDYGGLYERFWPILKRAAERFLERGDDLPGYGPFKHFCNDEGNWLDPYARYQVLKAHFGGKAWTEWPKAWRLYEEQAKKRLPKGLGRHDLNLQQAYQYFFAGQWSQLKTYANEQGISLLGDVPIFVSLDSADVWSERRLFQFNDLTGLPDAVAGVPPDYFSETGQLWGNPLFDWEKHTVDDFAWWRRRMDAAFNAFDVIRIDHFRGFDTYWSIPAGARDAREGQWKPGPGLAFFQSMQQAFGEVKVIAEDLGEYSESVVALRQACGFPGMAILQFAWDHGPENLYLPHNLVPNQVVYSGTHDNDTSWGWYQSATEPAKDYFRRYFRVPGHEVPWDFIRAGYASTARLAIFPVQDLFSLGGEARFNKPGDPSGNWQWRFKPEHLDALRFQSVDYLNELAELYDRRNVPNDLLS